MEYEVHYLIFGGAFWGFTLFGLALHAADVHRRLRLGAMHLEQYQKPRPIEWLLSALLLFAGAAAALGGAVVWGMQQGGADAAARFIVVAAAAVTAVALAYVGMLGKSWVHWTRDGFLAGPGATIPERGTVLVNVSLEAEHETALLRRAAWPVYLVGSTPLIIVAIRFAATTPVVSLGIALAVLAGTAVTLLVVSSIGAPQDDDRW